MIQSDVLIFLRNVKEIIIQLDEDPVIHYIKNVVNETILTDNFKRSEININIKDGDQNGRIFFF